MTENELRNQELIRHDERVDQNIERHQAMNLGEEKRDVAATHQNSAVAQIPSFVFLVLLVASLILGNYVRVKMNT